MREAGGTRQAATITINIDSTVPGAYILTKTGNIVGTCPLKFEVTCYSFDGCRFWFPNNLRGLFYGITKAGDIGLTGRISADGYQTKSFNVRLGESSGWDVVLNDASIYMYLTPQYSNTGQKAYQSANDEECQRAKQEYEAALMAYKTALKNIDDSQNSAALGSYGVRTNSPGTAKGLAGLLYAGSTLANQDAKRDLREAEIRLEQARARMAVCH